MDLLKAPSTISLVDSDVGSIESFQTLEIEELNDEEYGIPAVSELPSLESVLASDDGNLEDWEGLTGDGNSRAAAPTPSPSPPLPKNQLENTSSGGSLLKYVFLQGVSQQITTASERIGAGMGSAVSAWGERIAIGTTHGLVMAFAAQALRWCCQQHKDQAAVTALDYNEDGTRLLAGFARGMVVMYESSEGTILRSVEACGGGPWGVLRAAWGPTGSGGPCASVADTGGSVWLLRFTRILGVRGTKVACLFSGARGEVCAIEPLCPGFEGWSGVLALATLSRAVVVFAAAGGGRGRAGCQASLTGPPDCLPLLSWQPPAASTNSATKRDPVLCSARGNLIQFHQIRWGTTGPEALTLKRASLPCRLACVRWLGPRRLALLDSRETLHLWDASLGAVLETLDLSGAQLVYANAHFKGVATGGKVSEALARAGAGALGGAAAGGGGGGGPALLLLGRAGLQRVAVRAAHAAAHHHADVGRWARALHTMAAEFKEEKRSRDLDLFYLPTERTEVVARHPVTHAIGLLNFFHRVDETLEGRSSRQALSRHRAEALLARLANDPVQLGDPAVALAAVDTCVQMQLLDVLWGSLWEAASLSGHEAALSAAAGRRASEGRLPSAPPAVCQQLVQQLLHNPPLLQKALLTLPVENLDLHQVLSECKRLGLWSAWIRVTSAALRDPPLPLRDLLPLLGAACRNGPHSCPGDALLVYVADCLAGRDFPRGLLPPQDRPGIRHEILSCLLYEGTDGPPLPHLRALLLHDTGSTLRMLGMAYSEPPFVGPMGKLNRLKMTLSLHNVLQSTEDSLTFTEEEIADVVYFTAHHLSNSTIPADVHLIGYLKTHFAKPSVSPEANKLIEKAWLSMLTSMNNISNHYPSNEMMEMAQNTGRLKVIRHLREKAEKFDDILDTFLNDPGSENDMFNYLEKYAPVEERLIPKQVKAAGAKLAAQWPEHTANFLISQLPDLIPTVLSSLENQSSALVFTDAIHSLGSLNAEISLKHLDLLCCLRPDSVVSFLSDAPSTLLPDAALEVIRKRGIKSAEPKCLEACGDLSEALKSSVELMLCGKERKDREELAAEACSLCTKAAKVSGPEEAEALWRLLIEGIAKLPEPPEAPLPALLLEGAANHLPLPWLVAQLCGGGGHAGALRGALMGLLEAARTGAEAVSAAARLTGTELHSALATALRGQRILPVSSASCGMCHNPLHTRPLVRAYCCGHAFHLECDPVAGRCGRCGQVASEIRLHKTPPNKTKRSEPPQQFSLCIVAPPRPDLEGVI